MFALSDRQTPHTHTHSLWAVLCGGTRHFMPLVICLTCCCAERLFVPKRPTDQSGSAPGDSFYVLCQTNALMSKLLPPLNANEGVCPVYKMAAFRTQCGQALALALRIA